MSFYTTPEGRSFIQFQIYGKTFKKRLPKGTSKTAAIDIEVEQKFQMFCKHVGIEPDGGGQLYVNDKGQLRVTRRIDYTRLAVPQGSEFTLRHWSRVYFSTRSGARKRKLPFEIELTDVFKLAYKSKGVCCISGLPFSLESMDGIKHRPFAPSIDRIDCKQGYTVKNVRLVCVAVNYALNEFGERFLIELARSIWSHHNEKAMAKWFK